MKAWPHSADRAGAREPNALRHSLSLDPDDAPEVVEEAVVGANPQFRLLLSRRSLEAHISRKRAIRGFRGALAQISIQQVAEPLSQTTSLTTSSGSAAALVRCIEEGGNLPGSVGYSDETHLYLLLDGSRGSPHSALRALARQMSHLQDLQGLQLVTPIVGYVDLRDGNSTDQLFERAAIAFDCARSSLEIEPFKYRANVDPSRRRQVGSGVSSTFKSLPPPVVLGFQLALSALVGLGFPFLVYAICDALGTDISGPIYIGVVIVLVITSTTIWAEGFLALRPTTPPKPRGPFPIATIIIPAYLPNEAATIVETLKAFLRLDYPNLVQIILAYNGPLPRIAVEDELATIARQESGERFLIEPMRVSGSTSKAQNVNAAVGRARGAFVGIFDADHHPHPDSLRRAWQWLSNGWDIVQGRCAIRNGDESPVARMVAIEFEQIYSVSHPGRARLHGFGIFGGSNGYWRTAALHQIRMRSSMLTEDIDSSIRALTLGYKIASDRDLISEELAPTTWSQLLHQRLRWAQGWFQVSLRRFISCMRSPHLSRRQKLGLAQLLLWRELFPWFSIQVLPILAYWIWVHGWSYLDWTVPVFLATTVYTLSTGPGQLLFAYFLAHEPVKRRRAWFIEYLAVGTVFYTPFKDTISRISHLKEAMRERVWRVTPRKSQPFVPAGSSAGVAASSAMVIALLILTPRTSLGIDSASTATSNGARRLVSTLVGGVAKTIEAARRAAAQDRNADAAELFRKAIEAVPRRRQELLPEYAAQLTYAGRSNEALACYQEMLAWSSASTVSRAERLRGKALALAWAGQHEEELHVYDLLVMATPGDWSVRIKRARTLAWLGRSKEAVAALDAVPEAERHSDPLRALAEDVVVEAARAAARSDDNVSSVAYFERAFRQDPSRRAALLLEYADQLLYSGRANDAIAAYQEVVDGVAASVGARRDAALSRAAALLQVGKPEAFRSFVAQLDPAIAATTVTPERLIAVARIAAAADLNDASATLFRLALNTCKSCRTQVLMEYGEQLTFSSHFEQALSAFSEVIGSPVADTKLRVRAQRGRALALTWSNSRDALKAWDAYLAVVPDDAEARLHHARLLSDAGRHEEALGAFRHLMANDTVLTEARKGASGEMIQIARKIGEMGDNRQAAALALDAAALDTASRADALREYAAQVSAIRTPASAMTGRHQALDTLRLAKPEQKILLKALADSYARIGRTAEASAAFDQLARLFPDDLDIGWERLVFAGRTAARRDDNVAAAGFFEQAIALVPARRNQLLAEYADKLSYSGESPRALPLYEEVLAQPSLTSADRKKTMTAMANAQAWAGHDAEAVASFASLVKAYPTDVELRWNKLVFEARLAAARDDNLTSADLFEQAMGLAPERRPGLLQEYADKLAFLGRPREAIPLYEEVLLRPTLSPLNRQNAMKALADSYVWAVDPVNAKAAFAALVTTFPLDEYRWEKLVFEARDAASRNDNRASADLFAQALALIPAKKIQIQKEYADKLSFTGRLQEAVALYRSYLSEQVLSPEQKRVAQLDLARSLAWNHELGAALQEYRRVRASHPADVEAALGEARVLSWQGDRMAALAAYRDILASNPALPSALHEMAQVEDWSGHHRAAQAILTSRLAEAPDDVDANRLLAQSRYWMGRPDSALDQLGAALGQHPDSSDLMKLRDEIRRNQTPSTRVVYGISTQSDHVDIRQMEANQEFYFRQGKARIGPALRIARFEPDSGSDIQVRSLGANGQLRFNDNAALTANLWLNATEPSAQSAQRQATYDVYATFWPSDKFRIDAGGNRKSFDNIRSIQNGITADTWAASVDFTPSYGRRLTFRGSTAKYSDGNDRQSAEIEVFGRVHERPMIEVGLRASGFQFGTQLDNGYFNPDDYVSGEATVNLQTDLAADWSLLASLSAGVEAAQPGGRKPLVKASFRPSYKLTDHWTLDGELSYFSSRASSSSGFARTSFLVGIRYRGS